MKKVFETTKRMPAFEGLYQNFPAMDVTAVVYELPEGIGRKRRFEVWVNGSPVSKHARKELAVNRIMNRELRRP